MKYILFNLLPDDIIIMISKYLDNIIYRNGKYMYKINKNDIRYNLIENIKKPIKFPSPPGIFSYTTWFNYKNGFGAVLYYYYNIHNRCTNLEVKNYAIGEVRGTWRPIVCENGSKKYFINHNCVIINI